MMQSEEMFLTPTAAPPKKVVVVVLQRAPVLRRIAAKVIDCLVPLPFLIPVFPNNGTDGQGRTTVVDRENSDR